MGRIINYFVVVAFEFGMLEFELTLELDLGLDTLGVLFNFGPHS